MTTRAMGPGAGWHWLTQAINLGSHNARAVFGAGALLLAAALLPTVLQLLVQNGLGMTDAGIMMGLVGFSLLYSLLVMPPLIAGFLRVIHAAESGGPVRPGAIFNIFRDGGAMRVIGLVLLFALMIVLILAAVGAVFGAGFFGEIAAAMTALQSAAPGTPPTLPSMPEGFGAFLGLMLLIGLFFNGVYAISVGQVALTPRSVTGALADGFVGTLKNVLPLLVLLVIAIVLGIVALLILMLLVALLMFIGGLVHPALGMALAVPVYLGAMLVMYVIMFGVMYFMWRDICGAGAAPTTPVAAGNQVEM